MLAIYHSEENASFHVKEIRYLAAPSSVLLFYRTVWCNPLFATRAWQVCTRDVTSVPLYAGHTRQVKPYKNVTWHGTPCTKFCTPVKVTRMGRKTPHGINRTGAIEIFIALLDFCYIIICRSFFESLEEDREKWYITIRLKHFSLLFTFTIIN